MHSAHELTVKGRKNAELSRELLELEQVTLTVNHYEHNMDQELYTKVWWTLLHRSWADAACVLIRWQDFSAWKGIMAAILKVLKVLRKIENPSSSIDAYFPDEQFYRFHQNQVWNDKPGVFLNSVATESRTTTRGAAISNQFLIQKWQIEMT